MSVKPCVVWVAAALLAACSKGSGSSGGSTTSNTNPEPPPAPTAVGTPLAAAVVVTLDGSGGTLTSDDGAVTVAVPPGALAGPVDLGVQRIGNEAFGAVGDGYRFTPEAQDFAQPVVITFHYTDEEMGGMFPEAMGVAVQDGDGYWHTKQTVERDAGAKTLSVSTAHFDVRPDAAPFQPFEAAQTAPPAGSDWAAHWGYRLAPPSATVQAGKTLPVQLEFCTVSRPTIGWPFEDSHELRNCSADDSAPGRAGVTLGAWGIVGGGPIVSGSVSGTDSSVHAVYQAPPAWTDQIFCPPHDACVTKKLRIPVAGGGTVDRTAETGIDHPCPFGFFAVGADAVCAAPTWTGSASEQADLSDGNGGALLRHAEATVTWTAMPGDPTGTVFVASGEVTISATGTAGDCTIDLPPTTATITGQLQFFPTLVPPVYSASGTADSATCLPYSYICPDGTTTLCGDVRPWLDVSMQPLPDQADTISGSVSQGGITYTWSFARNPPHSQ